MSYAFYLISLATIAAGLFLPVFVGVNDIGVKELAIPMAVTMSAAGLSVIIFTGFNAVIAAIKEKN